MTPSVQRRVQAKLDAVAARSLQVVGDVVVAALPEIEARLIKN